MGSALFLILFLFKWNQKKKTPIKKYKKEGVFPRALRTWPPAHKNSRDLSFSLSLSQSLPYVLFCFSSSHFNPTRNCSSHAQKRMGILLQTFFVYYVRNTKWKLANAIYLCFLLCLPISLVSESSATAHFHPTY